MGPIFALLLAVVSWRSINGGPANYPANANLYEIFIFGGSYTPGDSYGQSLDIACSFLYSSTPLNGSELSVTYGRAGSAVWALSQCSSSTRLREHCRDCLIAARVHIDNFNSSYPLRGGGYWTNGTQYSCFLLYNSQPIQITAPEDVVTLAVTPSSTPPQATQAVSGTGWKAWAAYLEAGVIVVCVLVIVFCFCVSRQKALKTPEGVEPFDYRTLEVATNYFSDQNKLGSGGYGVVYKAVLPCGTEVAVKQIANLSQQGHKEFDNEVRVLTAIQHKNLVAFKGYCREGKLLVYEYLENKSLDLALFDSRVGCFLNWSTRLSIVLGVARGLEYLHQSSPTQIIHRDIKASNILLDGQLRPKICDFGLSRLFSSSKDFTMTKVVGTLGYVAPEVFQTGTLTVRADIYSFGVLALEIVSGRKCNDHTMPTEKQLLVPWARDAYEKGRMLDLVDTRLDSTYSVNEVLTVIHIALLCTDNNPQHRPLMSEVVAMLLGYIDLVPLPLHQQPVDVESLNSSSGT